MFQIVLQFDLIHFGLVDLLLSDTIFIFKFRIYEYFQFVVTLNLNDRFINIFIKLLFARFIKVHSQQLIFILVKVLLIRLILAFQDIS